MEQIDRLDRLEMKINFLTELFMKHFSNLEDPDYLTPEEEEEVRKAKEDWAKGEVYTIEDIENERKEAGLEI